MSIVVINMSRKIILLFTIIIGAQSIPAPEFAICKNDDYVCQTKNSNIIYKMSVAGSPELNIDSLDPMYQDNIVGDLGVVKYQLRNSTVEGFKDCKLINTKIMLEKSKMEVSLVCPYLQMYGLYQISGQLISMPIKGDGEYSLKFKEYYANVDADIKIFQGKDGKKYASFKNFKAIGDLRGGMIADVKNLFDGQKELEENLIKFVNENWKPVATLLQEPALNAHVKTLITNFNKNLKNIPLDKLFQE